MTEVQNKPLQTIRDGALKATIWRNANDKGDFISVTLSRIYKDHEGNFKETNSLSGSELLRIARLAHIAYDEILIELGQNPE